MKIFKFLVFEWAKKLGDKEKPYAIRWRVDFYFFSFRIHKWLCSDDQRAYHSHPVNMFIWIIKGKYGDYSIDKSGKKTFFVYGKGCKRFRFITRDVRHYIFLHTTPTWTFLFTWGVPKKWAFWLKDSLKKKNRDRYFIEHGNHICE